MRKIFIVAAIATMGLIAINGMPNKPAHADASKGIDPTAMTRTITGLPALEADAI